MGSYKNIGVFKTYNINVMVSFYVRSLLVAACEKKSIIMFDPLNRKVVKSVDYAHGDCVNCVR